MICGISLSEFVGIFAALRPELRGRVEGVGIRAEAGAYAIRLRAGMALREQSPAP
jgi:hypothetical protein